MNWSTGAAARAAIIFSIALLGLGLWLTAGVQSPALVGFIVLSGGLSTLVSVLLLRESREKAASPSVPATAAAHSADLQRTLEENRRLMVRVAHEHDMLEALMRRLPVGVLVLDGGAGTVSFANAQLQTILRVEELGELAIDELWERWQVRRADGIPCPNDEFAPVRALRAGESVFAEEYCVLRGDGTTGMLRIHAAPLRGKGGEISAAMVVCEDISEEREAADERKRLTSFREQFLGILGHDLRNPLNAIMIGADLLQRSSTSAKDRAVASRIKNSSRRMQAMVEQLLDLTRSRLGGGIPIHAKPMDLAELARQVVEEFVSANGSARVELDLTGDLIGEWDPDRLGQVVSNLVANAIKYGVPSAPVEVTVQGTRDAVLLSVHNRGKPIPPELMEVLFEPYRTVPLGGNGHSDGLGLGLFITSQIVLGHGGAMRVHTGEEGTTFAVELPRSSTGASSRRSKTASLQETA